MKSLWLFFFMVLVGSCSMLASSPTQSQQRDQGIMSFLLNPNVSRSTSSKEPPEPKMPSKSNPYQCFDDTDLNDLMKQSQKGLIYVLDAQMPLSFLTLEHIKRVAQNKKMPLTVLFSDSQNKDEYAKAIIRKSKYVGEVPVTLCSDKLILLGANLHYPNLFVYKNGKLVTQNFLGAKSAASYEKFISTAMNEKNPRSAQLALPDTTIDKTNEPSQWREVRRVRIDGIPGYYFKPLAGGQWVLYTKRPVMLSTEAKHDLTTVPLMKNHLLNLYTGKEHKIGGFVDPVPTPDEKIMSHPNVMGDYDYKVTRKHSLYSLQALIRGEKADDARIMVDETVPGTYQSFGLMKDAQGRTIYRMVAETIYDYFTPDTLVKQHTYQPERFFIQEYTLDEKGNKIKLIPRFKKPKTFCPNLKYSLPMLSKTGQFFAGANTYTRESKIMKINDGKCQDFVNIGIPTGKVDFAYDDSTVAFHVSWTYGSEPNTTYLNIPKMRHNMDVMTLDLASRELRRATHCQTRNANCYYPAFTKTGQIVYLEQDRKENTYDFVVLEKRSK